MEKLKGKNRMVICNYIDFVKDMDIIIKKVNERFDTNFTDGWYDNVTQTFAFTYDIGLTRYYRNTIYTRNTIIDLFYSELMAHKRQEKFKNLL